MTNLTITSNAETLSRDQTKTYWKIGTDQGSHSVWDKIIADTLKVGKTYDCLVEINGKYKTIRAVNGIAEPLKVETVKPENAFKESKPYEKDPVGLTLELYQAIITSNPNTIKELDIKDNLLKYCINAVKEVKKAFE